MYDVRELTAITVVLSGPVTFGSVLLFNQSNIRWQSDVTPHALNFLLNSLPVLRIIE